MARTAQTVAQPAARPLPDHLGRTALSGAVVQVLVSLLIAALAASRASAHVLSPLALAVMVAGSAATGAVLGWPLGLYSGARDVLKGEAVLGCEPNCPAEPGEDPFSPRALRGAATRWALMVGIWAGAGGALLAATLDGKRARLLVVFAALAGLAGLAGVVVDTVARHRGAHAARSVQVLTAPPEGLRGRGWRHFALPMGLAQGAVNAGMAWVLFHSAHPLTRSNALADVIVFSTLLAAVFGAISAIFGETDARLGRIRIDDTEAQRVPAKSPIGAQGFVYIVVIGLFVGQAAGYVLPARPTLLEVALARGVIGGLMVFLATGAGYVRGALNTRSTLEVGA